MLPNPSDVVARQATATARKVETAANRLLFVGAITAGGLVVLEDAEGNELDDVAWIGPLVPAVGDAVVVLTIPGRGNKHAAGTRVAIGPINKADVVSRVAPVVGAASGNSSDTASTTSTSVYSDAETVSLTLPAGDWTVAAHGTLFMRHSAASTVDLRIEIGGVGQTAISQSVVSAGFERLAVTAVYSFTTPSAGPCVVALQFKAAIAGTATADQPSLFAIAVRTG